MADIRTDLKDDGEGGPEPSDASLLEPHHRNLQGGTARAAVFGVSDGLVSNLGLILGVAGADPAPQFVRVAGLAGLIAGSISMAAGEYNSVRVQTELFLRELEMERLELHRNPHLELKELAALYESRGMSKGHARELAAAMMSDPDLALETHAREELGIDPRSLGSPRAAAASSFFAFGVGALAPLVPWFFAAGTAATVLSLVIAVISAVAVGFVTARFTERPTGRTVARQLVFTLVPAALTYLVGSAIGIGV